ncbi:MAG: hypothetical protein M1819_006353 [Sarea resinae]|nr:MAG: hypothetical protein M1819_006353 [Sarea resinae]
MSGTLLSYAGWAFLPNLATGWLQSLYYGITIRAGDPRPLPGTPRFIKHRRRIYILVVVTYLLYTIYEADWEIRRAGDFYQDLGLKPDVDERGIKSRFRRLAALHHPDKVGSAAAGPASEAYFVHLRLAQETLINPTKRFAYDRFGPDILAWRHCHSIRDYLSMGIQGIIPYYVGSAIFMAGMSMLGYLEWGRYWRYLAFASLLTFEFYVISRPVFPPLIAKFLNPLLTTLIAHPAYLPFQILTLARKITITFFIFLSQLGPVLSGPSSLPQNNTAQAQAQQRHQLDRLDQTTRQTHLEASRMMGLEMAPFAGDDKALAEVQAKFRDWLVQNTVRADPEVRDAVGRVLNKRRTGAPAGARGTK